MASLSVILTVHPRACGEHSKFMPSLSITDGSSPRLRGTRSVGRSQLITGRFIPAPAGNTSPAMHQSPALQVHPRACGEHSPFPRPFFDRVGSSPRLRGTPPFDARERSFRRFIPAPAGNTSSSYVTTEKYTVHPRACGEHVGQQLLRAIAGGSSPRLRGTQPLLVRILSLMRFIPAPAGNTVFFSVVWRYQAVHPRACGEHYVAHADSEGANGSSPRLRGTLTGGGSYSDIYRFIPAPAGNTCRRSGRPN